MGYAGAAGALDQTPITVGLSPLPTTGILLFDAVQRDGHLGTPAHLKAAIRGQLRRRDRAALAPLVRAAAPPALVGARLAGPGGLVPILCGTPGPGETRLDEALDAVVAAGPAAFQRALTGRTADRSSWPLLSDPERWLADYAVAVRRAWRAVEPVWARALPLLDREVRRVGAAIARGEAAELLPSLHPRGTLVEGRRRLPGLTVCPLLADPRATVVFGDAEGRISGLCYPLPGAEQVLFDDVPPAPSLAGLVGPRRAAILQRLDAPATCGEIAVRLDVVPAAATHHVSALERAGLVRRMRRGRHVIVERTARGSAVLALYRLPAV